MLHNEVVLVISSYIGLMPTAIHYYGKLVGYRNDGQEGVVELRRTLSDAEATRLNAAEARTGSGYRPYKSGMLYPGFDSKDELRSLAIRSYTRHFPWATVLSESAVAGGKPAAETREILDRGSAIVAVGEGSVRIALGSEEANAAMAAKIMEAHGRREQ